MFIECLRLCVRKWMSSLGSIRVVYLLTLGDCRCYCWRHFLFSSTTSIQPEGGHVQGFLVDFKPSFGLCQILYPCQRLHLSQILKSNYHDLTVFRVNKILPGIFYGNLQPGELQPPACPFQGFVAHAQQIAQFQPAAAALLKWKGGWIVSSAVLLHYPPKGPICLSLCFQVLCAWNDPLNFINKLGLLCGLCWGEQLDRSNWMKLRRGRRHSHVSDML